MVQHQWQQQKILLVLHQWLNDEKQNPNLEKVEYKYSLKNVFIYLILVFASNNEIDFELSPTTKEFIEQVHNAYIMHLKVFIC
jgi:hypothetical protein